MELFITLFILVANVVGLLLVYHSFDKRVEKNRKLMYTMISVGIIYILTLIVYFFSSLGMNNENVTENSRNIITFSFVPINTIILLPILIRAYNNRRANKITTNQLNRTTIIMIIIAIILIIVEFFSFRNIQNGIISIFNDKQNEAMNQVTNVLEENNIENNIIKTNTEIENIEKTNQEK